MADVLWWWHTTELPKVQVFVQRRDPLCLVRASPMLRWWKDPACWFRGGYQQPDCAPAAWFVCHWCSRADLRQIHWVCKSTAVTLLWQRQACQRDKASSVAQPKTISAALEYDLNRKRFIFVLSLKNIPVLHLTFSLAPAFWCGKYLF